MITFIQLCNQINPHHEEEVKIKKVNIKKGRERGRGGLAGHPQSNIREPRRPEGCCSEPHYSVGSIPME
jgi:hypothetical protein